MIDFTITGKIKFPELKFTKELEQIAERIIVPELAQHIQQAEDIRGSKYPPLSEYTIKKKRKTGAQHPEAPLIETGRLYSSFYYLTKGINTVIVRLKAGRREIGDILQNQGVKTKYGKRFFNFFGVTSTMENSAVGYMRRKILEKTRAYGKK